MNIACQFLVLCLGNSYSSVALATYTPVLEALDNIIAHLDVILRCGQSFQLFECLLLSDLPSV